MKRILVSIICLFTLIYCVFSSEHFTSSHSPVLNPYNEGLVGIELPEKTIGFILDDWTTTTNAAMLASPKLADLNGDGVDEILMTTYGINTPYGEGWLHAWDGAGNELTGFPLHLTGAPPGTPAIGDIDGNGTPEIVQGTWNYLYVFNADGSNFPGWPQPMYITQAVALADLDNDGDLEIIVPVSSSITVYHHNGALFPGFPVYGSNSLTAAAVGDIDGDGDLEIVAGSYVASGSPTDFVYAWHHTGQVAAGFPVTTAGSVKVPPTLADLDGDGSLEIIADCWNQSSGENDYLYVWRYDGSPFPGWPQNAGYIRLSSPSIADFDLDGDLEIVVGGWSTSPYGEKVFAFHHNGTPVAGFPVILLNSPSGNVNSTPTTGDIDGDGYIEIVLKAKNNIFALNHDGSVVTGFPVFLNDENHSGTTSPTPAIGDPDGDGLVEIFAASSFSNVMLIDQPGAYSAGAVYWPTFRNDSWNRGLYYTLFNPDVVVSLSPYGTPIVIPAAGGSFDFNVALANNGTTPANFSAWCMVTLPNGAQYGPVLGPVNLSLPAGASIDRDRTQQVPANAPPGDYIYNAYVGWYPNNIWNGDSFDFSKAAIDGGFASGDSWLNTGESFANESPVSPIPTRFILGQNYPNPFNAETVIPVVLPERCRIRLDIYNLNGGNLGRIYEGELNAGYTEVTFDAANFAAGVYFYRMEAVSPEGDVGFTGVGKMVLLK